MISDSIEFRRVVELLILVELVCKRTRLEDKQK